MITIQSSNDAIYCLSVAGKKESCQNPFDFCFADLEKSFDRGPRAMLWWAFRKLGVEEWAVCTVQGMYSNAWLGVCEQLAKEYKFRLV